MLAFEPMTGAIGMFLVEHACKSPSFRIRPIPQTRVLFRRFQDTLQEAVFGETVEPVLDQIINSMDYHVILLVCVSFFFLKQLEQKRLEILLDVPDKPSKPNIKQDESLSAANHPRGCHTSPQAIGVEGLVLGPEPGLKLEHGPGTRGQKFALSSIWQEGYPSTNGSSIVCRDHQA